MTFQNPSPAQFLASYWSQSKNIPIPRHPIGTKTSLFLFPGILLAKEQDNFHCLVPNHTYFHLLASYWPHSKNIPISWHPIGPKARIFPFLGILLAPKQEYSHFLASYWHESKEYSHFLASKWPHCKITPISWHPIGPIAGIFLLLPSPSHGSHPTSMGCLILARAPPVGRVLPSTRPVLVPNQAYSHLLASYWPQSKNIPISWYPVGTTARIFPFLGIPPP
jgi:hypothetical protein